MVDWPGKDELVETMSDIPRAASENVEYYKENIDSLQENYPGEWIAIIDGGDGVEVLEGAADTDISVDQVSSEIEAVREEYGQEAYFGFVPDPETIYIL